MSLVNHNHTSSSMADVHGRPFKVFVDKEATPTCDINNQAPATLNTIGADIPRPMVAQPNAESMNQKERNALGVKQFLAVVQKENGRKENVNVCGKVVARVAGVGKKALTELKGKKAKGLTGKGMRISAESQGEVSTQSSFDEATAHIADSQNKPKKVSKRPRHVLSSIGNAAK